ncbi:MAG TPA: aminotransferase class I/II-fold pyridoxal phosphate-dependent enzyme [Ktedonobacteraceae bacterium]|jgi:aspartate aminotransferase/aminotransferase
MPEHRDHILPDDGIMTIANRARKQAGCIRLELGEPDFPLPTHIRQAMITALDQPVRYSSASGVPSLQQAVTTKLSRVNHYTVTPEQVIITPGGVGALMASLVATVSHGDDVLVPDPAWPLYRMILTQIGASATYYPLHAENHWLPDLAELKSLITPRTRALIINTPSNPTGAVFPHALVGELIWFCQDHDLYLIADEAYEELVFEGAEHVSAAALAPEETRILSCYTFSKTYAMTGFRVGYAVVPSALRADVTQAVRCCCTNVSTLVQAGAEAALTGPQDCVSEMRDAYRERRDMALALLRQYDMPVYRPDGTFFLLIDVSKSGLTTTEFALQLLEKQNVAVAPGSAFGTLADHCIRLSLASSVEDLEVGIRRIATMLMSG